MILHQNAATARASARNEWRPLALDRFQFPVRINKARSASQKPKLAQAQPPPPMVRCWPKKISCAFRDSFEASRWLSRLGGPGLNGKLIIMSSSPPPIHAIFSLSYLLSESPFHVRTHLALLIAIYYKTSHYTSSCSKGLLAWRRLYGLANVISTGVSRYTQRSPA